MPNKNGQFFEINRVFVLACRLISHRHSAAKKLTSVHNFSKISYTIKVHLLEDIKEVSATVDGSWGSKRFPLYQGILVICFEETGKTIYVILKTYILRLAVISKPERTLLTLVF